jgi:hypothetical protein
MLIVSRTAFAFCQVKQSFFDGIVRRRSRRREILGRQRFKTHTGNQSAIKRS